MMKRCSIHYKHWFFLGVKFVHSLSCDNLVEQVTRLAITCVCNFVLSVRSELLKALYSPAEYCSECELLVAGSERSELSRANNNGITPLIAATVYFAPVHIVRVVRLLTAVDEDGEEGQLVLERKNGINTAAHYAALTGRADAIDALLAAPTETELQFVEKFCDIAAIRTRRNVMKNLRTEWKTLAASAVNARNELRETPLYVACKNSNVEAVQRLLQHHADPRIQV